MSDTVSAPTATVPLSNQANSMTGDTNGSQEHQLAEAASAERYSPHGAVYNRPSPNSMATTTSRSDRAHYPYHGHNGSHNNGSSTIYPRPAVIHNSTSGYPHPMYWSSSNASRAWAPHGTQIPAAQSPVLTKQSKSHSLGGHVTNNYPVPPYQMHHPAVSTPLSRTASPLHLNNPSHYQYQPQPVLPANVQPRLSHRSSYPSVHSSVPLQAPTANYGSSTNPNLVTAPTTPSPLPVLLPNPYSPSKIATSEGSYQEKSTTPPGDLANSLPFIHRPMHPKIQPAYNASYQDIPSSRSTQSHPVQVPAHLLSKKPITFVTGSMGDSVRRKKRSRLTYFDQPTNQETISTPSPGQVEEGISQTETGIEANPTSGRGRRGRKRGIKNAYMTRLSKFVRVPNTKLPVSGPQRRMSMTSSSPPLDAEATPIAGELSLEIKTEDTYESMPITRRASMSAINRGPIERRSSAVSDSGIIATENGLFQCAECGKTYKHQSCLLKHLWEHSEFWNDARKYALTKHQQVQIMEAAQILLDLEAASLGQVKDQVAPMEDIQEKAEISDGIQENEYEGAQKAESCVASSSG